MNHEADLEVIKQSQEAVQSIDEEILPPLTVGIEEEHSVHPKTVEDHIFSSFETRLVDIEASLSELKTLFEQRIRYDAAKDKAFDVLYDKMKQHESEFQALLKENLIRSLLLFYDSMVKTMTKLDGLPVAQQEIASLLEDLIDILYAENVELMEKSTSVLDRRQQKVSKTIPTSDPTQHHRIEQVVLEGFLFNGKVLRPQSVIVRQFLPSTISEPGEE